MEFSEPQRFNEGKVDWTLLPWDTGMIDTLVINLNELRSLEDDDYEEILIQSLLNKNITYCLAYALLINSKQPREFSITDLPWKPLEDVCRVFAYGCIKYQRDNYKIAPGLPLETYIQSMWRHLVEYLKGVELDEESKLPALAHLSANCFMYLWTQKTYHEPNTEDTSVSRQ